MLYRVFPFRPEADPVEEGGALHVPGVLQGAGRHDNPDLYVAYYASRNVVSVAAEFLRQFGLTTVSNDDFVSESGRPYAVAPIDDSPLEDLVDLDDPRVLLERSLRPSRVATINRRTTQAIARAIFDGGSSGFAWWSTIEASWINVTLFADRAIERLRPAGEPETLSTEHPAVLEAAEYVGVELA